jgi:hypothetical protein
VLDTGTFYVISIDGLHVQGPLAIYKQRVLLALTPLISRDARRQGASLSLCYIHPFNVFLVNYCFFCGILHLEKCHSTAHSQFNLEDQ